MKIRIYLAGVNGREVLYTVYLAMLAGFNGKAALAALLRRMMRNGAKMIPLLFYVTLTRAASSPLPIPEPG